MKRLFSWIKRNFINWLLNGIKVFLVAYISFYVLKEMAGVHLISEFWITHERYYLASYATIQVIVTFIFYTGLGKLFELIIYNWIKKNEEELVVELDKDEEKEVKKAVNLIVRFLNFTDILNYHELDEFEDVVLNQEEFRIKWKSSVKLIKNLAGIFTLALTNFVLFYGTSVMFLSLAITFVALIIITFFSLIVWYFLIENLHLVNLSLKSISISGRLNRSKNKLKK